MSASLSLGQRICVVGTSGSGKTYVAEALASKLGLTYVCNDAIIWRPGWRPTPKDEVYAALDEATRKDAWTFDGNLSRRPEDRLVLGRCDTVVWLDLPRWQVHSQVIWRTVGRLLSRRPLWHGNVERWRDAFSSDWIVWWSIRTYHRRRREYRALFEDPAYADRARIRLRSRRELDVWLVSFP